MAANSLNSDERLDIILVKITNPLSPVIDGLEVQKFCHLVCKLEDGAQQATKLLAYRIHSPQEKEALNSLFLLDQCVKSCGPKFHNEIGKFRFLNELIKLVSPKYDGAKTHSSVKQRVLELLFTWSIDVPNEPKIREAYGMLKKQGVIKSEPKYLGVRNVDAHSLENDEPVQPKARTPFLGNEEQERTIKALIQSGKPEDLERANRLIKNLVQQDEKKAEEAALRALELEKIANHMKILRDMMNNGASSSEEFELMQQLAETCEKLRPQLFKFAADTEGESLEAILKSADELNRVLDLYRDYVTKKPSSAALLDLGGSDPTMHTENRVHGSSMGGELLSVDFNFTSASTVPSLHQKPIKPSTVVLPLSNETSEVSQQSHGLDSLDFLGDLLKTLPGGDSSMAMGKFVPKSKEKIPMNKMTKLNSTQGPSVSSTFSGQELDLLSGESSTALVFDSISTSKHSSKSIDSTLSNAGSKTSLKSTNSSLDDVLLVDSISHRKDSSGFLDIVDLNEIQMSQQDVSGVNIRLDNQSQSSNCREVKPLGDLTVSVELVKPGSIPPMKIFERKHGLDITLNICYDRPRPDVSVIVLTTVNRNSSPVSSYIMQAIVPKECRIKILPASSSNLPAFNPILPPSAITQVVLLATPHWDKVNMKFVLSFEIDGETLTDMEEIESLKISN
ncbi:ADP-ribosylation factor-binding protein GGA2-like [Artemia franciscana]|uniref:ADP-ribosylation factor-binding protein GGA1 n=1 Tax=Artemia franciscana TaxID=6661 RepID=A0AA88HMJ0_ARTSF|nr:hypothetical protein QYM36_008931 [Artemia franciscana]